MTTVAGYGANSVLKQTRTTVREPWPSQENGQQAQTTKVVPRALYQRTFQLTSAGFSLAPTGFSPGIQQHTNNVLETSKGDAGADMTEMGFKY